MAFTKKIKKNYEKLSVEDLKKEIIKTENELISMIIQSKVKAPDNPMKIKQTKRLLALLKTFLREKELGIRK